MQFPAEVERWRPLVRKHFPAYAVDKALWVIRWESGGNPDASGDGGHASGLFQIQGNSLWPDRPYSVEELRDPEVNIRYADQMLQASGWRPWGEGALFEGKPFGALGNRPYPEELNPIFHVRPVSGAITSTFWEDRGNGIFHGGVDFAGATGTAILLPADGICYKRSQPAGTGFGDWVLVDHYGTPWWSALAHMSSRVNFTDGTRMRAGEMVGRVGFTGFVIPAGPNGAHLHWGMSKVQDFPIPSASQRQHYADPLTYFGNLEDDPQPVEPTVNAQAAFNLAAIQLAFDDAVARHRIGSLVPVGAQHDPDDRAESIAALVDLAGLFNLGPKPHVRIERVP